MNSQPPLAKDGQRPADISAWGRSLASRVRALRRVSAEEAEFRAWYTSYTHARVRIALWLTMGLPSLLLFAGGLFRDSREAVFGGLDYALQLDIARYGLFLPFAILLLIIAYSRLYARWFSVATQITVSVHAAAFAMLAAIAEHNGYFIGGWMILVVVGTFNVFGLRFGQALAAACSTALIYIGGGLLIDAGFNAQAKFDAGLVLFAVLVGAGSSARIFQGIREQYNARIKLREAASRDGLTGVFNRRAFDERLGALWSRALHERESVSIVLIDIDYFKRFNDAVGHQAGDECLVEVAHLLGRCVRQPNDFCARYGGEEFALVLYGMDRAAVGTLAQEMRALIATAAIRHPASPIDDYVTVSAGVACVVPSAKRHYKGVVQLADQALYIAKDDGRNRVVVLDQEYDALRTGIFDRAHRTDERTVARAAVAREL